MHPDTLAFLDRLYERCQSHFSNGCLTFSAIHPDGDHATPSRHLPLHDRDALLNTLNCLADTNRSGWGAYVSVGVRRAGLSRWQRGGIADVLALPALYADIDHPTGTTLTDLRTARLPPSIIIHSGGGLHAYWLLEEPTTDLNTARQVLQGLARTFKGDSLSPAQSMRLPGTLNPKRGRNGALCRLLEVSDRHYRMADFQHFIPSIPQSRIQKSFGQITDKPHSKTLNRDLINAVTTVLFRDFAARETPQQVWIAALCPCGHRRDHPGAHFRWNPTIGCGCCHGRHGTLRLTDLCSVLGIDAATYGGFYC